MEKIRTVVAHNSEEIRNIIVNSISNLEYVEVVGTAADGIDTYNKIIDLKPEMVFTKYDFNNMNTLDIMRKSKEKLDNNIPVFNLIVDDIPDEKLQEAMNIVGDKLNALVRKPYVYRVVNILEDYKEYINK